MYNKRYGFTEEVTLLKFDRELSNTRYQAVCMVAGRLHKEFFGRGRGEHFIITSRHDRTVLAIVYYPLKHRNGFAERAARLASRWMAELEKFM